MTADRKTVAQSDKIERVGEIALGGFLFRRDIRKELYSELHGTLSFKITE
jgi:hypothetical protein